ncbi:Cysteine desulfurase [Candidatus Tremblaya princeps]|uniref:Cysteine desulfurase n=1 Tax=Tremblaya princeps TaxID=189385 RepID=A0A143WNW6_TREPR|nr:Cysteine desulfurase [Candidatus Tremblaya princeps]
MRLPVYLDHGASTPVDPAVVARMLPTLSEVYGNPASESHAHGWRARGAVESARRIAGAFLSVDEHGVIWTSGATESNNLAIKGIAQARAQHGRHLVASEAEHESMLSVLEFMESEGFVTSRVGIDRRGVMDACALLRAVRTSTVLVCMSLASHETGVLQDVARISRLCSSSGVPLHIDAAQAAGRLPCKAAALGASTVSLSAHKCYGPKGVGVLYVSGAYRASIRPQMHGGGQQGGVRSGTLPTHQLVGMGEALRLAARSASIDHNAARVMSTRLMGGILALDAARINGSARRRVPHVVNASFACVEGESLIISMRNVSVSTGSACTSSTLSPSRTLSAMRRTWGVHGSLRFVVGRFTSAPEIDYTVEAVRKRVRELRALSPTYTSDGRV